MSSQEFGPGPRDKPLRKWDQIGELATKAIQSYRLRRRIWLVSEILGLLNENEEKAIGIEKQRKDEWLRRAFRLMEKYARNMAWYNWNDAQPPLFKQDYGVDKDGRRLSEEEWLDNWNNVAFDIQNGCGEILRLVCEFCESKGVRVGVGVGVRGPRGLPIGVSKIMAREVEVTRENSSKDEETSGRKEKVAEESREGSEQ